MIVWLMLAVRLAFQDPTPTATPSPKPQDPPPPAIQREKARIELKRRDPLPPARRRRLAVLDPEAKIDGVAKSHDMAGALVLHHLVSSQQFALSDPGAVKRVVAEMSSQDEKAPAAKVAKALGVEFFVTGNVEAARITVNDGLLGRQQVAEIEVGLCVTTTADGHVVFKQQAKGAASRSLPVDEDEKAASKARARLEDEALQGAILKLLDGLIDAVPAKPE